jgi:hypothetical protein
MATLSGAQVKVLLAVIRCTLGYHQTSRHISLTAMMTMTGVSRQGVIESAQELEKLGLIGREAEGGVTEWSLKIAPAAPLVNSVDQVVNSVDQVVNSVDQTGQLSRPPSKKETKKKHEKKTKEKKEGNPPPLAIQVYREIARRFPDKATWEGIDQAIGSDPAALDFWKQVITGWIGCGWNKLNVNGMLEFYRQKRIPTTNGGLKNGQSNGNSHVDSYLKDNGASISASIAAMQR